MKIDIADAAQQGIDLCRDGSWDEGLFCLSNIHDLNRLDASVVGRVYSYLGLGLAVRQDRVREGIELCERAIRLEFYEPLHYIHLAKIQIYGGRKRAALKTIRDGLRVAPGNKSLEKLRCLFGFRRPRVLRFLGRGHYLNVLLGRWRHKLFGPILAADEIELAKAVQEGMGAR